ncbi:MAG: nucleotidyltransferase [Opitutaceae bacterium]|nr:nucleotidyltransferase [Opitutaceae bacterium]
MKPTLLVLAAGMGSRYGGLKQIDPVGPSGETVLDYAVFDAIRAGFGRVVFIIRRDFEALFRAQIGTKYTGCIAVDYVFQALDQLPNGFTVPAGREKPWGTGHAVWCARDAIREPFAVINADDFYGADSFARLGAFLVQGAPGFDPMSGHRPPAPSLASFGMVGFKLRRTLSENGAVSRGICQADATGFLQSIEEHTGILASDVGAGKKYTGDETVSMNCWGFTPALFKGLDIQLHEFLRAPGTELKSEFYLPAAVSTMIARGEASVQLLPTTSEWFGVTYREDRPKVTARIAALVAAGAYPAKLF